MSELANKKSSLTLGIFFMCLSALAFSLLNTCIKQSGDLPLMEKCFFRNAVAFVVALFMMFKKKVSFKCEKRHVPYIAARAIFGTMGMFCNFYATYRLPLGDSACIAKLGTFFTVFFCFLFFKERFTKVHVAIMLIVIGGAFLVATPSFGSSLLFPYFVAFLSAIFTGLAYGAIRGLKGEVSIEYIVFTFSSVTLLITTPFFIINYVPMETTQLIWLLGAGVFAAMGQFAITGAYKFAEARQVSVYAYLQIPFSALIGFILFKEIPTFRSGIGYFIIIAMGVVLFFYERKSTINKIS